MLVHLSLIINGIQMFLHKGKCNFLLKTHIHLLMLVGWFVGWSDSWLVGQSVIIFYKENRQIHTYKVQTARALSCKSCITRVCCSRAGTKPSKKNQEYWSKQN